jgi:hypothetical protein
MGAARYAAYWTPDLRHPLWQAGCEWLGRDALSGWISASPRPHTKEPRRYGFHATLKAPMALRAGATEQDFLQRLADVAARHAAFAMPPLEVSTLRGFVALRPSVQIHPTHPLRQLADACVRDLDGLRRPATAEELDRRLQSMDFDSEERANIEQVGYAFAFGKWRFHMTLSDSFGSSEPDRQQRDRLIDEAREHFLPALAAPLECTGVSLFVEPSPGMPFVLAGRVPLAGR